MRDSDYYDVFKNKFVSLKIKDAKTKEWSVFFRNEVVDEQKRNVKQ